MKKIYPGIIANDEGLNKLCKIHKLKNTRNSRKKIYNFRKFIYSNENIIKNIFGIILHYDDFKNEEGIKFIHHLKKKNIRYGIKFDDGRKKISNKNEKVTIGLNNISKKILIYKKFKCSFAKWKVEFNICKRKVSDKIIKKNIKNLFDFVLICKKNKITPMIETDLVRSAKYSYKDATKISEAIYSEINKNLKINKFRGKIYFKTNLIYPGKDYNLNHKKSAIITDKLLNKYFKKKLKNIFFLSGGEKDFKIIKTIKKMKQNKNLNYSYAFSRGFFNDLRIYFHLKNKEKLTQKCNEKINLYIK